MHETSERQIIVEHVHTDICGVDLVARLYVCMCPHIHTRTHMHTHAHIRTHTHTPTHMQTHANTHASACVVRDYLPSLSVGVTLHTHTHIHVHTRIRTHTHTRTYTHAHMKWTFEKTQKSASDY